MWKMFDKTQDGKINVNEFIITLKKAAQRNTQDGRLEFQKLFEKDEMRKTISV